MTPKVKTLMSLDSCYNCFGRCYSVMLNCVWSVRLIRTRAVLEKQGGAAGQCLVWSLSVWRTNKQN